MTDNKIIQFPSKMKVNSNIKISDTAIQMHTDLKFADHLTEGLVVNLIHNLGENDIDTSDPKFIKDVGFLIELVKSIIYRDMGITHPMQELVELFVNSEYDDEHGMYTEFDIGTMEEVIKDFVGDTEE